MAESENHTDGMDDEDLDPMNFSSPTTTEDEDDDLAELMGSTSDNPIKLTEIQVDGEQFRGTFHVPEGYDPATLNILGGGSFGSVAAVDYAGEPAHRIAIKKLTRPFQDVQFALRTVREMLVLKHVDGNADNNIVNYIGAYTPDTADTLDQVYIAVEAMDMDLRKAFRNKLTEPHIRYIMYQVCNGIRYLHSAGILHRDLKPENIAISMDASVRLIDMGLCRVEHRIQDTPYVQTRFYRAPEVICMTEYDYSSDWWSFGCILAECYVGKPIFQGKNSVEQLRVIFDHLGPLTESFMTRISSQPVLQYISSGLDPSLVEPRKLHVFGELERLMSSEAYELMRKILVYDYPERPSADEIIYHALFDDTRPAEPPLCSAPLDTSFENLATEQNQHAAIRSLKQLVWAQCTNG
eukprot:TRINITY_DN8483_c0_g1_i2.p1 TRINITY_DN8483_c0_g1~~TRINITY_DN8483_c0_g1_i2.p1  ORF type:complete len:409 (+),score=51.48 TRINITY_DN8483_c0_g1_i2:2-1228(+)